MRSRGRAPSSEWIARAEGAARATTHQAHPSARAAVGEADVEHQVRHESRVSAAFAAAK